MTAYRFKCRKRGQNFLEGEAKRLKALRDELLAALKDIMPDRDISEDCLPVRYVCRWCGRDMERNQVMCASDDCPGFKARAAIAAAEDK